MGSERLASSPAVRDAELVGGRYRIEAALGKGGVAQVYRATDTSSGREVALKKLRSNAPDALAALFELEYQTLASLRHPHMVEVYDFGREVGGPFYTMELLQGVELIEIAPMPFREACTALRDAAQALGVLHARKLIHRDVSPRNLWRTPDGLVKLIDFGALSPFGPNENVMGTPPMVPPEAMDHELLDQRADLFALGGVAYFLLTGFYAFPASSLGELRERWKFEPIPPSEVVTALARPDLEPIPAELDRLVLAMLSRSAAARPTDTAEVIDRLDAVLDAPTAKRDEPTLSNPAFVGRTRACRSLRRQLRLAGLGRGQSTVIEGEAGLGRSRLLRAFALEAKVTRATVLAADAGSVPGMYGAASSLALKLLDALPEVATATVGPYAPWIVHASPRLRARLGVEPETTGATGSELRVRVQACLRDWFLAVAERVPLVVLVDGLEQVDEGTGAFLLALALERRRARVLLVCALLRDRDRSDTALLRALCQASHRIVLGPITEAEAHDLFHSLFGDVQFLTRLSNRLWRAGRGNPGHMLELCAQLVHGGLISFEQGTCRLPTELPDALLSTSREQALAARLDRLDEPARALARVFSVYAGAVPMPLAKALADTHAPDSLHRLDTLLREEIVAHQDDGVRFVHEQFRLTLLLELSTEARRAAQRAVAEWLLSLPEPTVVERLRAGVNLLECGDRRGRALVARAGLQITMYEADHLSEALPYLEEALALFRAQGRSEREQVLLLAPLALAGLYADRRFALRYGEQTLGALQRMLGLARAHRLRRFLGAKLGLYVALALAGFGFLLHRKNPLYPSYSEALVLLFTCVAALAGSSTLCIDVDAADRYADILEPLTALGPDRLGSFMYEYCRALTQTVRDEYGDTYPRWQRIIARLDGEPIKNLPDPVRIRYLGGALFAVGVMDTQRCHPEALRTAERLDSSGLALHRMNADQLRTLYYGNMGQMRLFKKSRARAEYHAIQQGTSWQIETWGPTAEGTIDYRHHDAMAMKLASEQLARLAQTIPSLDVHARRWRGAYLAMRRKYVEALPWLEGVLSEPPKANITWGHTHGMLAHAYNRTGAYTRAREVCLRALAHATPDDLAYPVLWQTTQCELLIAEANLGRSDEAMRELERLLAQHHDKGQLILGALHETGFELALIGNDRERARLHLTELTRHYLATEAPSLAQHCAALEARLTRGTRRTDHPLASDLSALMTGGTSQSMTSTVDRMLGGGVMSLGERAHKALQVLAEQTRCAIGFLYLIEAEERPELVASLLGETPSPDVVSWVERRVAAELEDARTHLLAEGAPLEESGDELILDERRYRALSLLVATRHGQVLTGIAVVGARGTAPTGCPPEVLRNVAYHLHRAQHEQGRTVPRIS